MHRREFEKLVEEALGTIPADFRDAIANMAIVVEDEDPSDPDLYGVFEGIPLTEGGPAPGELPNRIAIFRRPLEADFDDVDELREEIRITVLHELGHYFGLDEDRLAELGYLIEDGPQGARWRRK